VAWELVSCPERSKRKHAALFLAIKLA
jgi:hypothetical protein